MLWNKMARYRKDFFFFLVPTQILSDCILDYYIIRLYKTHGFFYNTHTKLVVFPIASRPDAVHI